MAQRIGDCLFFEHGAHTIGSTGKSGVVEVVVAGRVDAVVSAGDVLEVELSAEDASGDEAFEPSEPCELPQAEMTRAAPMTPIQTVRKDMGRRMSS